jgi:hypothetical protein
MEHSLLGACRALPHHKCLHGSALGHIEARLDHQIVDCLEDIRDHVQLLLNERIAQRQLVHNLQGFFASPHNAAVLDVFEQYRNLPRHAGRTHEGNEVLRALSWGKDHFAFLSPPRT